MYLFDNADGGDGGVGDAAAAVNDDDDDDNDDDKFDCAFFFFFQYLIAALTVGIFDDIEYIGKGEWVTDTALAHYRGYDVDNTRRLMNTLAAMKLLDRGKSVHGYGHGELTVNCENSYCHQQWTISKKRQ